MPRHTCTGAGLSWFDSPLAFQNAWTVREGSPERSLLLVAKLHIVGHKTTPLPPTLYECRYFVLSVLTQMLVPEHEDRAAHWSAKLEFVCAVFALLTPSESQACARAFLKKLYRSVCFFLCLCEP